MTGTPHCADRAPPRRLAPGFTLVEALVAISLAVLAGSAILLSTTSSVQNCDDATKRMIALGLAEQLMDEILGQRYCAVGADGRQVGLGPSSWEAQGQCRERYNDIDDYHGVARQPPADAWGVALGKDDGMGGTRNAAFQATTTLLTKWRQEVSVYYVDASNPSLKLTGSQTSDYRMIEVRITEQTQSGAYREWVKLRRVVCYVPELP